MKKRFSLRLMGTTIVGMAVTSALVLGAAQAQESTEGTAEGEQKAQQVPGPYAPGPYGPGYGAHPGGAMVQGGDAGGGFGGGMSGRGYGRGSGDGYGRGYPMHGYGPYHGPRDGGYSRPSMPGPAHGMQPPRPYDRGFGEMPEFDASELPEDLPEDVRERIETIEAKRKEYMEAIDALREAREAEHQEYLEEMEAMREARVEAMQKGREAYMEEIERQREKHMEMMQERRESMRESMEEARNDD